MASKIAFVSISIFLIALPSGATTQRHIGSISSQLAGNLCHQMRLFDQTNKIQAPTKTRPPQTTKTNCWFTWTKTKCLSSGPRDCSKSKFLGCEGDSRIINGQPLPPHYYSSLMSMRRLPKAGGGTPDWKPACGGVLIAENWALTSAHCVGPDHSYRIIAGEHNTTIEEEGEQTIGVAQFIQHPKFDAQDFANDIALLKLETSVQIRDTVAIAQLPQKEIEKGIFDLVGCGTRFYVRGPKSDVPYHVTLPSLSLQECTDMFPSFPILDSHICLYKKASNQSACSGDSGSPLYEEGDKNVVHGVTSVGINGACSPSAITIYTKVYKYLDWIANTIK